MSAAGGTRRGTGGVRTHRSSSREKRFLVRQKSHMPANPLRPTASSARARGPPSSDPDLGAQDGGRAAAYPSRPCAGHHAAAAGGGEHRIRGGGDRRWPGLWGDRVAGGQESLFCLFASPFYFSPFFSFFLLLLAFFFASLLGFALPLSFSAPGCFVRPSRHLPRWSNCNGGNPEAAFSLSAPATGLGSARVYSGAVDGNRLL